MTSIDSRSRMTSNGRSASVAVPTSEGRAQSPGRTKNSGRTEKISGRSRNSGSSKKSGRTKNPGSGKVSGRTEKIFGGTRNNDRRSADGRVTIDDRAAASGARRGGAPAVRRPRRSAGAGVVVPPPVAATRRKIPFAVPIGVLILAALGVILFLSTRAAEDSYALELARQENQVLSDRRDELKRDFDAGDSAPELAAKAGAMGMVPAEGPAHLLIAADGTARLDGRLHDSTGDKVPALNKVPDPAAEVDPSTVFDSRGLPQSDPNAPTPRPRGDASQGSGQQSPAEQGTAEQGAGQQAPATNGPREAPAPPAQVPAPTDTVPAAPNVLPGNATPAANAPQPH